MRYGDHEVVIVTDEDLADMDSYLDHRAMQMELDDRFAEACVAIKKLIDGDPAARASDLDPTRKPA